MANDINIQQIPNAPGGYSLTGKKVMVHDQTAPLSSSTVMVNATDFAAGGNTYAAPLFRVDGGAGSPVAGVYVFTHASLIGASQLTFLIVNKIIEILTDDFTFNSATGTITRNNAWQANDSVIIPHKTP